MLSELVQTLKPAEMGIDKNTDTTGNPKITRHFSLFLIFNMISFTFCDDIFDYSPYAIDFKDRDKNLNHKNIGKLIAAESSDTITIALTADTHRFYDELDQFVHRVNENPSIDFVIHAGDMADFGLPEQYLWGNSYLSKLNAPYFVVVGNHDLVANGVKAYNEMFGPLDFSFIYDSIKYVFINTNSREFNFDKNVPDIDWLDNQLRPGPEFLSVVVVFHVPPTDVDFDQTLELEFRETLERYNNVLLCVHGHLPGSELYRPYDDAMVFLNVIGVDHRKLNIIRIVNHQFELETIEF